MYEHFWETNSFKVIVLNDYYDTMILLMVFHNGIDAADTKTVDS